MVFVLIVSTYMGVLSEPRRKIVGVYGDEATCDKNRSLLFQMIPDPSSKRTRISCEPWKIEKD